MATNPGTTSYVCYLGGDQPFSQAGGLQTNELFLDDTHAGPLAQTIGTLVLEPLAWVPHTKGQQERSPRKGYPLRLVMRLTVEEMDMGKLTRRHDCYGSFPNHCVTCK